MNVVALGALALGVGIIFGIPTIIQPPWYCAVNSIPIIGGLFGATDFFQCNQNFLLGVAVVVMGLFLFKVGGKK